MRRRYTAKQRQELIDLVTAGRLAISEAAVRLGVPLSTTSYWTRKAAQQPQKPRKATQARKPAKSPSGFTPKFVQVIRADGGRSVVKVRIGRTVIHLRPGFDVELVRTVIALLREVAE